MKYTVTIPYPAAGDYFTTRTEQQTAMRLSGMSSVKWTNSKSTPSNWIGYNEQDPSPGIDLCYHAYEVECSLDLLALLALRYPGLTITN